MTEPKQSLNFAVFGDIHGRIALMYVLAILWQQRSGIKLDGLLQVGDLGAFPDVSKLDEATQKHALKDTDELGFQDFCQVTPESQFYLLHPLAPPTYFIRGNHEDFEYLGNFRKLTPIDPWGKILFIPDNCVIQIGAANQTIRIAGFGGIAPTFETPARGKSARTKYRQAQKNSHTDPRRFRTTQLERIPSEFQHVDILMTHAGAKSDELPTGSIFLDRLVNYTQPRVHLFGHHHRVIYRENTEDNLLTIGLDHLDFDSPKGTLRERDARLRADSWGILSISPDSRSFDFMSPENCPWLDEINRANYRTLVGG